MGRALRSGLFGLCLLAAHVAPVWAQDGVDALIQALDLRTMAEVLEQSATEGALAMDGDWLNGQGGAHWQDRVGSIIRPGRYLEGFRAAVARDLTPEQIEDLLAFYEAPLGQLAVSLESSANVAMRDPGIEAHAMETVAQMWQAEDPALKQIAEYDDILKLTERNTAATLAANLSFFRGIKDVGGAEWIKSLGGSIEEIVWAEEALIRDQAQDWLWAFLNLAHGPLSQADKDAYFAFSRGPASQDLNTAIFEGYAAVNGQIMYEIGRALGQALKASSL